MTDLSLYRPNMGIALFNPQGLVWLGRRSADDLAATDEPPGRWRWQMPQGGVDEDETFETAAKRELEEETGARSVDIITITPGWLTYRFPEDVVKRGRVGQRQKWAAMLFRGAEEEFDLIDASTGKQEFDTWRWAELEETLEEIVPFKRHVYEEVIAAFSPLRDLIRNGTIR